MKTTIYGVGTYMCKLLTVFLNEMYKQATQHFLYCSNEPTLGFVKRVISRKSIRWFISIVYVLIKGTHESAFFADDINTL